MTATRAPRTRGCATILGIRRTRREDHAQEAAGQPFRGARGSGGLAWSHLSRLEKVLSYIRLRLGRSSGFAGRGRRWDLPPLRSRQKSSGAPPDRPAGAAARPCRAAPASPRGAPRQPGRRVRSAAFPVGVTSMMTTRRSFAGAYRLHPAALHHRADRIGHRRQADALEHPRVRLRVRG